MAQSTAAAFNSSMNYMCDSMFLFRLASPTQTLTLDSLFDAKKEIKLTQHQNVTMHKIVNDTAPWLYARLAL